MHRQSRFPLVLFISLLTFLLAAGFISCKTEEETRTVEITSSSTSNTTGPVTCTVQEANYILHYQQKILTADDGGKYVTKESEGFELAEYEDRSKTKVPNNSDEPIEPVKAGTEFKDLAKDYKGFSYSYAIQVDSTVYIYYTRNTVKYTFYDNSSEVFKVLAIRSGTYGLPCEKPNVKIDGKLVTQWQTNGGEPFIEEFKAEDLPYYPVKTKYAIGTKIKPTALGDIVFCDGSAASMVDVKTATGDTLEKYKENAIAVIVFDKYDTLTGSASDGDTLIGVGIQALNSAAPESGERYKSLFNNYWRANSACPTNYVYICESFHGYYDLCDLKNLFPDYFDDKLKIARDWTAISIAMNYGNTLKEKNSMDVDDELLDGWYLPNWQELSLLLASYYKYYKTLNASRIALGMTIPTEPDSFWVTATKTQGTDPVYAAYVKEGDENNPNIYTPFKLLLNGGEYDNYWAIATTEKYQILPFREFK